MIKIGSWWQHYNGVKYQVLFIANETDSEKYPKTVVYIGENGKVWTRPLLDWERSFKEISLYLIK